MVVRAGPRRLAVLAALLLWSAAAAPANAAGGALYCDGGTTGALTDAEHSAVTGDPPLPAGVQAAPTSAS